MLSRLALCCLIPILLAPLATAQPASRTVAVTIDDGPITRFFAHPSQWHRQQVVDGMLDALAAHGAPATLFAIGEKVDGNPEGQALLAHWLAAGVEVGNHTHRHLSLARIPTRDFLADIDRASGVLRPLLAHAGAPMRYFRAPYLQDGATAASRAALLRHLDREGMRNAPVTIALEDWRFNDDYEAAERAEDWAARYEIGQAYLRHAAETIAQFDELGRLVAGRDVAHVLLVHANTINRDYLGPIMDVLAARGFAFVSLEDALRDPLYRREAPPSDEGGSLLTRLARQDGILAER